MRAMSGRGQRVVCPRSAGLAVRWSAALAVAILLAAATVWFAIKAPPATATATARAAACGRHDPKGVTVVVDFTKFRKRIEIGCDPTRPANGLVALRKAGFSYAFVPRQPGFICTIDKEPRKCNGAPASAYWSYWHAKPHGKWIYSTLGAASYHPKSGWVEGWAFGNGKPPRISPP
jgi:hypothetical protein